MLYLAIGCAALAMFVWLGRGKPILKRREWRFLAGAFAIACFAAAAYVGLWLLMSTRRTVLAPPPRERMGETEARSILGVPADASQDEIKEAYARLMRMAHPDKGGTSGLAAQLNAARDRLLKK
jgi:DnaJ-domain-containing protein 1